MCGIAGFWGFEGGDPVATLDAMLDVLDHRGPDDRGSLHWNAVHVGMTRLAIIDPAGGAQPMSLDDDSVQVVMNGEIYNHRALRRELERQGHRFSTKSDTEVMLRGWTHWREGVFERADGMFAIAIVDRRNWSLTLARDRFGEKPLFVWERSDGIAFASEPKALRPLRQFPDVDRQALVEYLHLGYVPAPRSIWRGIRKLQPAEITTYKDRSLSDASTFWAPGAAAAESPRPEPVQRLRTQLLEAVESRLVADVEVGVLLSGGIDSSLVAWAAAERQPGIKTFTVAFEDDPSRDESAVAARTSAALGTEHHVLAIDGRSMVDLAPSIAAVYDEPYADSSALPTMLLCRAVASHVKVALTGDGGDELFSGYPRYANAAAASPLRAALAGPLARLSMSRHDWMSRLGNVAAKQAASPAAAYRIANALIVDPMLSRLVGHPVDLSYVEGRIATQMERHGRAGLRAADLDLYLPDDLLVKVDRASMAASLEVRAPFLTPELCGWALGLTDHDLGPPGAKSLPRRLAADVLPPGLASLPKQGFSVPLADWLRGPLADDLAAALAPSELAADGLLDPVVVDLLRRRLANGRRGVAGPLWALLVLQHWRRGSQ